MNTIPDRPPAGPVVKVRSLEQMSRGGSSSWSCTHIWK